MLASQASGRALSSPNPTANLVSVLREKRDRASAARLLPVQEAREQSFSAPWAFFVVYKFENMRRVLSMLIISDPLPETNPESNAAGLLNCKIGSMEVFRFDCELIKMYIPGNTSDCNCGWFKICGSGVNGWGQYMMPCMTKPLDLVRWASVFMELKGHTIPEAFLHIQSKEEAWGPIRKELAESALKDLAAKLLNPLKREELTLQRSYLIEHSESYYSF
jgi:hypothetical protein